MCLRGASSSEIQLVFSSAIPVHLISPDQLAIFGGTPAFAEPLYVGRPNIPKRENLLRRIDDMLDRRWLTNAGPFVRELEQRIAEKLDIKHCIAMCNGTVALEICIRAL